jgi:hypothetical protein
MAKEFILVPKARYEELINKNPTTFEHLLPQQMTHDIPSMDVSSQTGNGHFVTQTTEGKIPGILDRPDTDSVIFSDLTNRSRNVFL